MIECPRCGSELSEAGLTSIQPIECPICGYTFSVRREKSTGGLALVKNYFTDVWRIMTHPRAFFRQMPTRGGLSKPLCFALITHWLGSALGYLSGIFTGSQVSKFFENFFQTSSQDPGDLFSFGQSAPALVFRERIIQWFFGTGPIIADPFLTLASLLITSCLVFVGARILISPHRQNQVGTILPPEVTFESVVRIICFGMSPSLLAAFPLLGGLMSQTLTMIVTIIGVQEVYKVRLGRAIVVALFPKVLLFAGFLSGMLFFAVVIYKLMAFFT